MFLCVLIWFTLHVTWQSRGKSGKRSQGVRKWSQFYLGGKSFECFFSRKSWQKMFYDVFFWGVKFTPNNSWICQVASDYRVYWVHPDLRKLPYWVGGVLEFCFVGLFISSLRKKCHGWWLYCQELACLLIVWKHIPCCVIGCHLLVFVMADYPLIHAARNILMVFQRTSLRAQT